MLKATKEGCKPLKWQSKYAQWAKISIIRSHVLEPCPTPPPSLQAPNCVWVEMGAWYPLFVYASTDFWEFVF